VLRDIQNEGKNSLVRSNDIYFVEPKIEDNIRDINRFSRYIFKYDIDKDGEDEIITEQIKGSGRFPSLLIFKYDKMNNHFFVSYYREGVNYQPFLYENGLFFCEEFFNRAAGRYERLNLVKIDLGFSYQLIKSYLIDYTYNLPPEAEKFITIDEIKNVQNQNYEFLNNYIVSGNLSGSFSLLFNEHKIDVRGRSSNFADHVEIDIYGGNNQKIMFNISWGFTLREIEGINYIAVLGTYGDHEYIVVSPMLFHLVVYELSTLEEVYENSFGEPDYFLRVLK
jgi:hypothetical protein